MTQTLWSAADKLRGNLDAAEYKHVALGLIFLKYISDRFEERRAQAVADPEELRERDRYILWRVYEAHTTRPIAKPFANPADLLERSMMRVELSGMVGFVEPK
jgi:type I restriction-modification system DNA methylase subunit